MHAQCTAMHGHEKPSKEVVGPTLVELQVYSLSSHHKLYQAKQPGTNMLQLCIGFCLY